MNIINFNVIESSLWFLIATIMFLFTLTQRNPNPHDITKNNPYQTTQIIATISFIAFGISDVIEAYTGAWWRPLGLLALKAICVIAFAWCYYSYWTIKKKI